MRRGFTLIEMLVVTAIIAILTAIIGLVYSGLITKAKQSACAFNLRQMMVGVNEYLQDYDDAYPQTKKYTTFQPQIDDANGSLELPDSGNPLGKTTVGITDCPADGGEEESTCPVNVSSYVANGYFVWGLNQSQVRSLGGTILVAERRSYAVGNNPEVCDDIYHPWYNSANLVAPRNDMDEITGAIATGRHNGGANYAFVDGHALWMKFTRTWSPPNIDLHTP